ncbi:TRAP transporter substrate-binding protein [Phaeovulum sp. W22_SRMD_FR3]|uniref:TRAP transporter substrate-binding protein n=1 Tax=Phaeovulum sp. W22_SRMD_FR3 TaxID=3240274 RepID=UPI003F997169
MFARSVAAGAVMAAVLGASAMADELKFANFMAPTHPYVAGAFQPFADAVGAKTNGGVTVKLYNGGELGAGPVDQYSRVVDGVAELAISLPGYTASNFPLTLLTELPGVITETHGTQDIWDHIDLFQPEYKRAHLVSLWSSAPNLLFTRDKAVRTPADLAGLKIRVPSRNAGLQVEVWGGAPVSMPVSEVYNALQTGVIDGAMIDGTAVGAFKLSEVANYITMGMDTTISPFFIVMNKDVYADLSEAEKAAIDAAGKQASFDGNKVQLAVAENGIASFAAMAGKEVIHLTAEEAAAFNVLSKAVVETVIAETKVEGSDPQAIVTALKSE